jgi:hypothetical protein
MLLFFQPADLAVDKLVVSLERVYDIWASSCTVVCNYDSGELIEIEGTYQKKLGSVRVVFDDSDEVDKVMRQFYKAVNAGSKAFYFGQEKKN